MKKESFISIIIPTLNSEVTLHKCLDSIIKQTYRNYEILIIDAVSKDKTLEIAQSYHDACIKIISEPDKGIYDAMNKGIKLAQGEWIYFIGSDDELYNENVLEKIAKKIKSTNKKIVYGNAQIIGNAGWAEDGDIYDGYFNLSKILDKNICHQTIFYNRIVFEKVGFYNIDYLACSDWDFNLSCFAKYKFDFIDTTISNFNGGNTSLLINDSKFSDDKWRNISVYFKTKLYKKEFDKYIPFILPNIKLKTLFFQFVIVNPFSILRMKVMLIKFKKYFLN